MSRSTTVLVGAMLVALLVPPSGASGQEGTGTITGRVTALDGGGALADVCVEAVDVAGTRHDGTARTGPDGAYRLEGVAPGFHLVLFNACEDPRAGYVPTPYGFDGSSQDPYVVVEADATSSDIDASLATAGTITGRVTEDGTGAGLADVCVTAVTDASVLASRTRTAGDGTYELTTAAPGDNQVVFVDCEAPRFHTPEVYPDEPLWPMTEEETRGQFVPLAGGGSATGIDAALAEGGSIEGTVTLAHTGRAAVFQAVGAWHGTDRDELPTAFALSGVPALGLVSDVFAATDGTFDLPGLPVGDYALELAPEALDTLGGDLLWRQRWYAGADRRADADLLAVEAGTLVDDVRLELVPTSSIELFCPDQGGSRYPDVAATNTHAPAIECMSDAQVVRGGADGRYRPTAAVRRDQMASFIARLLETTVPHLLPGDPPDAFRDDDGNVHARNIDLLAAVGIVEGDRSGRYRPGDLVGRGQMATFLARSYEFATGAALRTPPTAFEDVEGTQHATNIRKVAVAAIAAGTSATTYEPNVPVRRDQMATFLARLSLRVTLDDNVAAAAPATATAAGSRDGASTARRTAGVGG